MLADTLFYISKVFEKKWGKRALDTLLSLEKLNYDPKRVMPTSMMVPPLKFLAF
ncbi:MAG: hypothetical protein XD50_0393 [Clostridia bacterium 41_269]|nr:MAG: hypothetical protein XD50_0393 [Clostridia bacterium 41_269]